MMTTFDDTDLLPTDVEPLTDEQVVYITDRLANHPSMLAYYLLGTGITVEILAGNVVCSVATYRRLCLSGLPRDEADIALVAERHQFDLVRLAQLFGFCQVPFIGRRSEVA